jgi:DNA polymerase-1
MRAGVKDDPSVQNKEQVVAFLDTLRRYRRVAKEYGTYVRRLIPYNSPLDGFQFASEDEQEEAQRGLISLDGRVRPDYNAHGTTSGRLSSSNPNAQNWPKHLRKLIIPAPGNVIVGADADQLELRIITAIAQIRIYLEAFAAKKDPHAMTASLMFGAKFDALQPKSDMWDKLRKIAKGIKYASFYGSGDETVHNLVTSAEDENGNLMYPDLTLREVATLKRNWLKGIPELPKWWDKTVEGFREKGYVRDPVWGRQRDFLDGEAFNEIVNHPIQSAGAHIIHESTFDLLQDIPFGKWGPNTGLISQVHDALYVECPESEAEWVEKMLKKHMNRAVWGLDGVEFAAKPKTGKTWADV